MPIFQKLKHTFSHANFGPGTGMIRELGSSAVGAVTSYALGRAHGQYRDHEHIEKLPLAVGALGKALALVGTYLTGGRPHFLVSAASEFGQAGINAELLSRGIADGFKAAGRKMLVLPPGTEVPKGLPASATARDTILGAIPPPAAGRYLSRDRLTDLARQI